VPLSDGHHVLFVDPPTGRLFLGCDAPIGGPTKLYRKIMFVPPKQQGEPWLYTSAADLNCGVRVVAMFGDSIMFYSVPPDVLAFSQNEQSTTSTLSVEGLSTDHWLNWWEERPANPSTLPPHSAVWPIALRGCEVGRVGGVCHLAVYTVDPGITIWAFSLDGIARTWQMRTGSRHRLTQPSRRHVSRSGIVDGNGSGDADSDVFTAEIIADDEQFERGVGFDGNYSQTLTKRLPRALAIENDEWVDLIDVRGCDAWYDEEGDVIMYDSVQV
jgi:hypothetical protein